GRREESLRHGPRCGGVLGIRQAFSQPKIPTISETLLTKWSLLRFYSSVHLQGEPRELSQDPMTAPSCSRVVFCRYPRHAMLRLTRPCGGTVCCTGRRFPQVG